MGVLQGGALACTKAMRTAGVLRR